MSHPATPSFARRCCAGLAVGVVALLGACASPVPAPSSSAGSTVQGKEGMAIIPRATQPIGLTASEPAPASVSVAPPVADPVPVASEAAIIAPVAVPPAPDQPIAKGLASWYGPRFHGRRTASGERYDMHALTAAHKTLPFGTLVRVRSVQTGKEVVVRINDRGPYRHQRIIDLSLAAITALGVRHQGVASVVLLRE